MEQKTIIIDGVEYICTPKESEPKQSEQPQEQPKRWRDDESATICGFSITMDSEIKQADGLNNCHNRDIFATEKQAKSALAMAQISQIMANDPRFGGFVTNEEWEDSTVDKFIIYRGGNNIRTDFANLSYEFLAFHTEEQCDLFLEENEDLVRYYFMLN